MNNDFSQPIIKELNSANNSNHGSATNLNNQSILNTSLGSNVNSAFATKNNFFNTNNSTPNNNNTPRYSLNFPSSTAKLSAFKANSYLKTRQRSGSITTLLPSSSTSFSSGNNFNINRDVQSNTPPLYTNTSLNLSLSQACGSAFSSSLYANNNTNNTNNNKEKSYLSGAKDEMNRNKPSNFPILQPKRKKSNSLSIIDYCNILSMNTNYQMLANFYDDTEASMARLSLKTTRNANIQKQANLSEQMAALFGSSMCNCYLCKLKTIDAKKAQQHNFEITPNKDNADYTIMKFTYSTPFSQLSCLKLFNLMNTDVSITFNNGENTTTTALSNSSNTN